MKAIREIVVLESENGNVVIPCPAGYYVRVLSLFGTITGIGIGDVANVSIERPGGAQLQMLQSGQAPGNNIGLASFLLGGVKSRPLGLDLTPNPATYYNLETVICGELPSIWWPFAINLSLSVTTGTITGLQTLYEKIEGEAL